MSDADGWEQNSKLVMHELARLNASVDSMDAQLGEFRQETKLELQELKLQNKFKQGFYGMLGGGSGVAILAFFEKIFRSN